MCLGHDKWAEDWKEMMVTREAEQEMGVVGAGSDQRPVADLGIVMEVSGGGIMCKGKGLQWNLSNQDLHIKDTSLFRTCVPVPFLYFVYYPTWIKD